MKQQVRIVRVFFIVAAALVVAAFYAGFYFGETRSERAGVTENGTEIIADETEKSKEKEQSLSQDAVESMTTLSPDKYYLKENDGFLSVYKGTSTAVYFDTDIKVDELPETLRDLSEDGIAFDDLASVYEFLENYSS